MIYKPHLYQDHAGEHTYVHPYSGLFLEVGLGKTVITLTTIDRLLYHDFAVSKPLIIAPKRVAENTWSAEIAKWDHLKHVATLHNINSDQKDALLKLNDTKFTASDTIMSRCISTAISMVWTDEQIKEK